MAICNFLKITQVGYTYWGELYRIHCQVIEGVDYPEAGQQRCQLNKELPFRQMYPTNEGSSGNDFTNSVNIINLKRRGTLMLCKLEGITFHNRGPMTTNELSSLKFGCVDSWILPSLKELLFGQFWASQRIQREHFIIFSGQRSLTLWVSDTKSLYVDFLSDKLGPNSCVWIASMEFQPQTPSVKHCLILNRRIPLDSAHWALNDHGCAPEFWSISN